MGLSMTHLLLLVVILLVVFGPSRLPALGKSLGESMRGFKKGLSGDEIDITPNAQNQQRPDELQQPQGQAFGQEQKQKTKPHNES